jgi:UDP-glucose 4-epimerase
MGGAGGVLNCGYGRGHSVREVLRAVERAGRHAPAGAHGPAPGR